MGWVFGRGFDSRQVHFFKKMGYKGECEKTAWLTRFSHFLFYPYSIIFYIIFLPYLQIISLILPFLKSAVQPCFLSPPSFLPPTSYLSIYHITLSIFFFYKIPRPSNNIFTPIIIKTIPPANSAPER